MKDSRRCFRLGLLLVAALVALPVCLTANNLKNFTTVFQTDYAVFGAGGMRGQGTGNIDVEIFGDGKSGASNPPGSIVVSGIEQSPIKLAYLYWHGPTDDPGDTNANVTFNGTEIKGANIGNSSDNCWGFQNSKAYRADVTSLVTGDGVYTLSNFRKTQPFLAEINGVSLVIFYDDGNPNNDRDVVIFDGNDSDTHNPFDSDGWSATLSGINYTSGTVNLLLIVSDGQGEFEGVPDDELRINGVTFLPACGENWSGDTVPDQGTAQNTDGGLWDQKTFDVTSLVSPGLNTLKIQPTTFCDDCLSLIAAIFDLPAGSAPQCDPPPPAPKLSVDKTSVTFGQAVTLSWNETIPAGQGSYQVQLSVNGNDFSTIGSVGAKGSGTAKFVYVLASPGNYRFQVIAVEGVCMSTSNSVDVTATGPCPQAPTVTGVVVVPSSAQPGETFTLSWDPATGTGNVYDVFLSIDGGQTFQQIGSTTDTSFTGTVNQPIGATMTFEVEVAGCVYSQKSNFATLTVLCDPPGPVSNIQIQAFGVTPARPPSPIDYILVSWTPPSTGTPPTRYGVRINGDPEVLVIGTSVVLPPRGTPDPITAFVTAYACAPLVSAELYDPATGIWSVTGNLQLPRQAHTASLLDDGRVLVAGGVTNLFSAPTPTAELYDPASAVWTTTGPLLTPRDQHTATALPGSPPGTQRLTGTLSGSLVLVEGGLGTEALASSEVYDPAAGSWSAAGALGTARDFHTATLLTNGKVLVVGGLGSGPLASAELYDSVSQAWTATGSLAAARYRHTATLLADGRVLVAGGFGVQGVLSSAEIYDPATGAWTSTGALAVARQEHTALLLPSGNVLVAGGDDGSASIASAEIYSPTPGTWTATGNLVTARRSPVAALLANGQVLVAGGLANAQGDSLTSAELYNPATGIFAATGSLHGAHGAATATLLGSGKVLLAGAADSLGTETAGASVASDTVALFLTPPVASFTISADPRVGEPVIFTDTSSPQATSWLWIFDDDTTDPRQSPTHVFTTAAAHQVSLIASNSAGSSTATQSLVVAPATAGIARVTGFSVIPIDARDPQRQRARVRITGSPGAVLLRIETQEAKETIVYLRFLGVTGALLIERRLSIPPGGDAVFDLAAYGLRGEFVIELVSNQRFQSTLSVTGRPSVREIER